MAQTNTSADPFHPAKLYGLDHLRAFAISFVFIYHYQFYGHPHWMEAAGKFGWTGVDLFFVLSGYLISSQLFKELDKTGTISFRNFFIKRSFRILPAYLLVVGIYFLVPAFREREALPPLWRFLTFTQNFGLDRGQSGTFSHAWSLCVEEQFYLLLPVALLLLFRTKLMNKSGILLPALVVFGVLIRWMGWHVFVSTKIGMDDFGIVWYKYIYYPIYNRLDSLLIGIAIAALFHFKSIAAARIGKYSNWLLPLGLAVLAAAYYICIDEHSYLATLFGFTIVALGYGLVVFAAISKGNTLRRYRLYLTERLASLSYGVYLIHKGVIHLVQKYFSDWGVPIESNRMLLLCIFFILTGALLLQVLVERPFLKIRDKVLAGKSGKQPVVGG